GNFIADHVKGNLKDRYPDGIRKGIELHRSIDHFTDTHPFTLQSKRLLYERHSKYAGVVVDLYYDHFLAANFSDYSDMDLKDFIKQSYGILTEYEAGMPETVRSFLPFMIERDWLGSYASVEGVSRSLTGLSRRVRFPNRMHEAGEDLKTLYPALEDHFKGFFPELITFVAAR
ncbi:MAG: ACP phosphodiesterase, partial [Bacteroidota bacterium]